MDNITGINSTDLKKGDPEPSLPPGRARLYSNRYCMWAERTVLYIAAKGIDIEIVNIDLLDKPDWYFTKHPLGKVPVFEKDEKIVFDSAIIPEYLDAIYFSSSILPTDPFLKAEQRMLLELASPLLNGMYGLFEIFRGELEGDQRSIRINKLEDALEIVEKLLKKDYFGGSTPGFADWMLYPSFERIAIFSAPLSLPTPFSSARWPKLSDWWARISTHPAAVAVKQPAEAHLAAYRFKP